MTEDMRNVSSEVRRRSVTAELCDDPSSRSPGLLKAGVERATGASISSGNIRARTFQSEKYISSNFFGFNRTRTLTAKKSGVLETGICGTAALW